MQGMLELFSKNHNLNQESEIQSKSSLLYNSSYFFADYYQQTPACEISNISQECLKSDVQENKMSMHKIHENCLNKVLLLNNKYNKRLYWEKWRALLSRKKSSDTKSLEILIKGILKLKYFVSKKQKMVYYKFFINIKSYIKQIQAEALAKQNELLPRLQQHNTQLENLERTLKCVQMKIITKQLTPACFEKIKQQSNLRLRYQYFLLNVKDVITFNINSSVSFALTKIKNLVKTYDKIVIFTSTIQYYTRNLFNQCKKTSISKIRSYVLGSQRIFSFPTTQEFLRNQEPSEKNIQNSKSEMHNSGISILASHPQMLQNSEFETKISNFKKSPHVHRLDTQKTDQKKIPNNNIIPKKEKSKITMKKITSRHYPSILKFDEPTHASIQISLNQQPLTLKKQWKKTQIKSKQLYRNQPDNLFIPIVDVEDTHSIFFDKQKNNESNQNKLQKVKSNVDLIKIMNNDTYDLNAQIEKFWASNSNQVNNTINKRIQPKSFRKQIVYQLNNNSQQHRQNNQYKQFNQFHSRRPSDFTTIAQYFSQEKKRRSNPYPNPILLTQNQAIHRISKQIPKKTQVNNIIINKRQNRITPIKMINNEYFSHTPIKRISPQHKIYVIRR